MDNSISKTDHINFLATKVSQDQNSLSLKEKNNQDLKNVAEQFESIFVHQMLKQARQSRLAEGVFSSEAQDTLSLIHI